MTYVQLVFLLGAACISPVEPHVTSTEVYKVPCAEFRPVPILANPYKAAQEPNVVSEARRAAAEPERPAGAPRARATVGKKEHGLCGSRTAVWYSRGGHKRYRCR